MCRERESGHRNCGKEKSKQEHGVPADEAPARDLAADLDECVFAQRSACCRRNRSHAKRIGTPVRVLDETHAITLDRGKDLPRRGD